MGAPVFLTKNGRGKYAIVDMREYEKFQATIKLMNKLAKGRKSGEEDSWLTILHWLRPTWLKSKNISVRI